ncbi:NADH-ubiquinone oxidoreductase-F iron-sulfur binding region domain-containing protein [Frondihabitans australicus]|uniref:NADH dehydrogenase subunit F n=1 Tax=Frondihabitans australicus TaxID=386892 RepID=A0A495IKB9_9MICO|nr:NADH-ubiquinone oxidoreductase-F iron-sulfur binding region domain-containing protein [Frondihabitans australicus]RKR76239.1 NADH dehydrogenase subunit F [Frondihabitans australicus]
MTLTQPIHTTVAPPAGVRRLFATPGADWRSHLDTYGPMPGDHDEGQLLAELEASGLSGRGGAGFPAWRKLLAAAAASRDEGRAGAGSGRAGGGRGARGSCAPVVIANGAEGEPLSRKDQTLLAQAPHLVLDGLLLAASVLRAGDTVLYATEASLGPVRRAISERQDATRVRLIVAPHAFLSGEATAVVRAVSGGPALPRDHAFRLTTSGLGGAPTLVQNVETLAHLALLARFGAAWFTSVGVPGDSGTRLVSISGDVPVPQVFEVPGGVPLGEALLASRVALPSLRAVLVGGYHGAWVPASAFDAPLSPVGLAPFGAAPGAGILMALGAHRCGVAASAEIATYLAAQSAKQCGPCANGLPRLAEVLQRVARRERAPWLRDEVARLAAVVRGRGSCHHPDGTSRFVLSTLDVFASDVAAHLEGRCEVAS